LTVPNFVKNPRLIVGVLVGLWLAYVIEANLDQAVMMTLFPWVRWEFRLPVVMLVCIAFGCVATMIVQYLWRRRYVSKPTEPLSPATRESSKTSA
jgi:uncharacterized integral membrane protein